tara:strand:+ start:6569 stop:6784 length:216 start_codon:yes stop_codon:yes gene_type:complete
MEYKKPGNVCPRCGSDKINLVAYLNIKCVVCNNCGFDERNNYEVYPEDKVSQKEKGRFSPYKAGGGNRGTK